MVESVNFETSRREILQGGLLLGVAAILGGCEGGGPSADAPDLAWPDQARPRTANTTPAATPTTTNVSGGMPRGVIPRSAWTNAQPNMRVAKPMNGVSRITIHHDAMNSVGVTSESAAARRLAGIRADHTSRKDPSTGANWVDIGYHYIIDPAGRVWQGRPVSIEGAHVAKTNDHNLGIMVMGNFDEQSVTREAMSTLSSFVAAQMRQYRVGVSRVYTHQELKATACPGRNLQRLMQSLRSSSGPLARA